MMPIVYNKSYKKLKTNNYSIKMEDGNEFVDKRSRDAKNALFNNILDQYRADKEIIEEKYLEYDRHDCEVKLDKETETSQTSDKKVTMNTVTFDDMIKAAPPLYTETKKMKKKSGISLSDLEKFVNDSLLENGIPMTFDLSNKTYKILDKEVHLPHSNVYEKTAGEDVAIASAPAYHDLKEQEVTNPYYVSSSKSWVIPKKFSGSYTISENNIDSLLAEKVKKDDREEMLHQARTSIIGLKNLLKLKEREYKGPLSMLK
uniref:P protein n=1 Tax=Menghai virus TaxID=1919071 RepID=A0A899IHX0_9RHAB|nr:P protein [Menghai virus]QSL97695.1 P protein [Menghai virus]QSL97701.1 P protein [Menghai virus]QSL97707.1 P protein [Menghai virus]